MKQFGRMKALQGEVKSNFSKVRSILERERMNGGLAKGRSNLKQFDKEQFHGKGFGKRKEQFGTSKSIFERQSCSVLKSKK